MSEKRNCVEVEEDLARQHYQECLIEAEYERQAHPQNFNFIHFLVKLSRPFKRLSPDSRPQNPQ